MQRRRLETATTVDADRSSTLSSFVQYKPIANDTIRMSMPRSTTPSTLPVSTTSSTISSKVTALPSSTGVSLEEKRSSSNIHEGGVAATATSGGVDILLQQLNDTGENSTLTRTANDWESFKTDTGLGVSLEAHTESKGAFLKKKDFLDRVDYRIFEHERIARERERGKKTK